MQPQHQPYYLLTGERASLCLPLLNVCTTLHQYNAFEANVQLVPQKPSHSSFSGLFLNFACTIAVSRKRKTSHPYRLWKNSPPSPHKRTSKALHKKIQLLTFFKPQTIHSKQVLPTPTQPCRTIIALAFKHTHAVHGINAQQSKLVLVWAFFWNLVLRHFLD